MKAFGENPLPQNRATDAPVIEFTTPPLRVGPKEGAGIRQFSSRDKEILHRELISRIRPERLSDIGQQNKEEVREEIRRELHESIARNRMPYSGVEREQLVEQMLHEVYGCGPLQPLLDDPTVDDIMVNSFSTVYVERHGVLEETTVRFSNEQHLRDIIDRIVSAVGRHVDESAPMVDARLADGSRVNVVIPPLAIDGPLLSIRKFGRKPLAAEDLIANKTLTQNMLEFLSAAVRARLSIIVSGGTGAGKTTLLNVLSKAIGPRERIVTIEDSAELQMQQRHVVRLECRPASIEGKGEVRQRALVINALRMRPDRIVLGEVRGDEALDLLQAMNSGHDGSISSIHANSPRDAIARLESMVLMGAVNLPERSIMQQIASAVNLIVQVSRMSDGTRRITHIAEISGIQGDTVSMQDIFTFDKTGIDPNGRVKGVFRGARIIPHRSLEIIKTFGIQLSNGIFDQTQEI